MKTLTLSAIVGGLILAGIIVTVHSCNSNPEPVAKPAVDGDSVGSSAVVEAPQQHPSPTPVTQTQSNSLPSPLPPPSLSLSPSLSPTPPKQKPHTLQDRCFSVRVPASSDSAPTITSVPCK